MSLTPIERVIDDSGRNPTLYMFSCGLCSEKAFCELRRDVRSAQEDHELRTGHNVSFIRNPIKPRRKAKP